MDSRSAEVLRKYKIDSIHTARQITSNDFLHFDYIFGMDKENIKTLKEKAPHGSKARIELLGLCDCECKFIIPDPYHDNNSSGFEECYEISYRPCSAFLNQYLCVF